MRGKGNAHFRKMLAQAMREIDWLRQIIYTHADAMRAQANSWDVLKEDEAG